MEFSFDVGTQVSGVDNIVEFASVRQLESACITRGLHMQDLEGPQKSWSEFCRIGQVDVLAVEHNHIAGFVAGWGTTLVEVLSLSQLVSQEVVAGRVNASLQSVEGNSSRSRGIRRLEVQGVARAISKKGFKGRAAQGGMYTGVVGELNCD